MLFHWNINLVSVQWFFHIFFEVKRLKGFGSVTIFHFIIFRMQYFKFLFISSVASFFSIPMLFDCNCTCASSSSVSFFSTDFWSRSSFLSLKQTNTETLHRLQQLSCAGEKMLIAHSAPRWEERGVRCGWSQSVGCSEGGHLFYIWSPKMYYGGVACSCWIIWCEFNWRQTFLDNSFTVLLAVICGIIWQFKETKSIEAAYYCRCVFNINKGRLFLLCAYQFSQSFHVGMNFQY